MNKVILMGRLTRDPDVRYSQGENATAVARFTLAVDRRFSRRDGENTADFIGCVAFARQAEFAEKYLRQGTKVVLTGRIQTGSYTNRDGQKVYTTDVVAEDLNLRRARQRRDRTQASSPSRIPTRSRRRRLLPQRRGDGFMNIPDGIDEELPFN